MLEVPSSPPTSRERWVESAGESLAEGGPDPMNSRRCSSVGSSDADVRATGGGGWNKHTQGSVSDVRGRAVQQVVKPAGGGGEGGGEANGRPNLSSANCRYIVVTRPTAEINRAAPTIPAAVNSGRAHRGEYRGWHCWATHPLGSPLQRPTVEGLLNCTPTAQ